MSNNPTPEQVRIAELEEALRQILVASDDPDIRDCHDPECDCSNCIAKFALQFSDSAKWLEERDAKIRAEGFRDGAKAMQKEAIAICERLYRTNGTDLAYEIGTRPIPRAAEGRRKVTKKKSKPCSVCSGSGKVAGGDCCCGTGEGCILHNPTAISLWGNECPHCKGTGKEPTDGR